MRFLSRSSGYFFLFLLGVLVFLFASSQLVKAVDLPPSAQEHIPVCTVGNPETPRCHARVIVNKKGKPQATTSPTGYGPSSFLAAYNLNPITSQTRTIAIVDAYDHPNILSDLNTYSQTYQIASMSACPVSSGTTASPCFQKVNQRGDTTYPTVDSGWALETSLDVETAHAICQNCNILLVEADSSSYANLMAGVDRAVSMGAKIISNSYGSNEFLGEASYDTHFTTPGVVYTFSSGDNGYGAQYPAASRYVTAVGGTTLTMNGSSYISESVWNGSGSGCSSYESKPSWQKDKGCSRRTVADVSADADPNTGASVYDSVPYSGQSGWFQVGGTSLAAPLIASIYALAGDVSLTSQANSLPYTRLNYSVNLRDVTTGSNGNCNRRTQYLCKGQVGYDGPSGLGTPLGIAAF